MAKRLGSEFWQRHLKAWKRSGLTRVAYPVGLAHERLGGGLRPLWGLVRLEQHDLLVILFSAPPRRCARTASV
jgi:hypothetical protein